MTFERIGWHKDCHGIVTAWNADGYLDGRYFYDAGAYCEKCHKKFEGADDAEITPRFRFMPPKMFYPEPS